MRFTRALSSDPSSKALPWGPGRFPLRQALHYVPKSNRLAHSSESFCTRERKLSLHVCFDSITSTDCNGAGLVIEQLESAEDVREVAKLRSDAYYEDQPTRFLETFKRQFVDAEVRSLLQRTGLDGRSAGGCICLLARRDGQVQGTLDIYIPLPGPPVKPPAEVPPEDTKAAYVNNVCVASAFRRQGVARHLMLQAGRVCKDRNLERVFVHVDADNEAALGLYKGLGFEETGLSSAGIGGSTIGRRYVLRWSL